MEANDILMGGGVASAKFPIIGTKVAGQIVRGPDARQQTDIETGMPLTFASGDPRMQVVVQLQTNDRDPSDADDDGVRGLYIKGNMLNAIRDAVKKVGAKGLEMGGYLAVEYVADGERKNKAFDPPKLYAAIYAAPSVTAANEVLMTAPVVQPAAVAWPTVAPLAGGPNPFPQPAIHPAYVAAVAAAAPPVPPAPVGVDPALWARMEPAQQQAVLAAIGQTPSF